MESVKQAYYGDLFPLNPGGIIPSGPDVTNLLETTWSRQHRQRAALKVKHKRAKLSPRLIAGCRTDHDANTLN